MSTGRVLLIGMGTMGRVYAQTLTSLGWDQIDGYDIRTERSIEGVNRLNALPADFGQYDVIFVLSNTHTHGPIIVQLIERGARAMLVEKPITWRVQDLTNIDAALAARSKPPVIEVGYLLPFSGAYKHLRTFMEKYGLYMPEGRGRWQKCRLGDSRPSAGNAEDEMTHPLHLLLTLMRGHLVSVDAAAFTYLPFVDATAQQRIHEQDGSYPLNPTSTSMIAVRDETGARALVTSSFTGFAKERVIEVVLATPGSHDIRYVAKLEFDVNGMDTCAIYDVSTKSMTAKSFPSNAKLKAQVRAFLAHAGAGVRDQRSTTYEGGARMVRILETALNEHQQPQLSRPNNPHGH